MRWIYAIISSFIMGGSLQAQCPATGFTVQGSLCKNENLQLEGVSSGAGTYSWDFCSGDLLNNPVGSQVSSIGFMSDLEGIVVAQEGSQWFGFVTGRAGSKLARLDFGGDLNNPTPALTNLGSLGILSAPSSLYIAREGNQWYGIVLNSGDGKILRLDFGTSLMNVPTAQAVFSGLSAPYGMAAIPLGTGIAVAVTESGTQKVRLVHFANGIGQLPTSNSSLSLPSSLLFGISLIESCGNFSAFALDRDGYKLFRIDYGFDFGASPVITDISAAVNFAQFPYAIKMADEGGIFVAYVTTNAGSTGGLIRINFGPNVTNNVPSVTDLGALGLLSNTYSLDLVKTNSRWYGFTSNGSSGAVQKLEFPENCSAVPAIATLEKPTGVVYSAMGSYSISLKVMNNNGHTASSSQSITVSNSSSPDISFSSTGNCLMHDVNFTSSNLSGDITSYTWDFGDATGSTGINPVHQFSSAALFDVNLEVVASNGCYNKVANSISIYNEPIAGFSLPAANPICTSQPYLFSNTSTFDVLSNPSWEWWVNGSLITTDTDLKYTITAAVPQNVTLKAKISGCEKTNLQTINTVILGPSIDFTANDGCQESLISFLDTSSGSITGFTWDFGDGNQASIPNPTHAYSISGNYTVTLVGMNADGCQNSNSKMISIYSKPQPNFSLDLPPFSCSGTPSQFNDLTPNPTDSNLSSWQWSFGDAAGGSSTQRNPAYTYDLAGPYTVSLSVSTNFGCTGTVQKSVVISQSPLSEFTWGPSCLNQPTSFTSAADPSIQSWTWNIGTTTYSMPNPAHVFSATGQTSVQLTTTGTNGCVALNSKTLTVPVPSALNFSAENACSGKEAVFKDTTPAGTDAANAWSWDFAGKGTATGTPAKFTFADPGVYSVKMSTVHASGCEYSITNNTTIHPSPVARFAVQPESGPPPLEVQFTNQSANAVTYFWKFNDSANSTSTLASPAFTYLSLNDYSPELTATSAQGCQDSFSKEIFVINPYADVAMESLMVYKDESTLELYPVLSVKNNSNFKVTTLDVWLDVSGGGVVKEKITTSLLPGVSQLIVLSTGVVPRGGETYLCTQLKLPDDAKPENDRDCLSLHGEEVILAPFPNPAKGELCMDWIAEEVGPVQFTVYNSTGQTAFHQELTGIRKGLNQLRIDISHLGPGMYFVRFDDGRIKKSFKQVIN